MNRNGKVPLYNNKPGLESQAFPHSTPLGGGLSLIDWDRIRKNSIIETLLGYSYSYSKYLYRAHTFSCSS